MIRFRFVTSIGPTSAAIRFATNSWCSHVEAVIDDKYVGAHADGGVMARDVGYDAATWTKQLFVDLPCTDAQLAAHRSYLLKKIGTPYDMEAILGFVLRNDQHLPGHMICSALAHMSLRQREAPWFPWPLLRPAHETSPADLLLILSSHVLVKDPELRIPA